MHILSLMNAHTHSSSLPDKLPFLPFCIFYLISSFLFLFHSFLSIIFFTCSLALLITFPPPSPQLLTCSVYSLPLQCWRLDGEAPALSDSQVQRHPMNFFTERAGMRFQGARNHTHTAYTNTLILFPSPTHCSSSPSFNHLFFGHSSFFPTPHAPLFLLPSFSPSLSPSLLSCLGVKFSRCT